MSLHRDYRAMLLGNDSLLWNFIENGSIADTTAIREATSTFVDVHRKKLLAHYRVDHKETYRGTMDVGY